MKLKMFNVGFGDCFIFSDANVNFLVDCGTIKFRKQHRIFTRFEHFVDYIATNELDRTKKNVGLISHFHNDHYGGFKKLERMGYNNIFDKLYIPYIALDQKTKRPVILELAIYIYLIFGERCMTGTLALDLLEQINKLSIITKGHNIECMYKGKKFNIGTRTFDVLWPQKLKDYSDLIIDYLIIIEEELNDIEDFEKIKEKIIVNMTKWYSIIERAEQENKHDLYVLEEIEWVQRQLIDELENIRTDEKVKEKLERLKYEDEEYTQWFKRVKVGATKIFANSQNETSIVFQDNDIHENCVLMTGDITVDIIKYLDKNKQLYDTYYCIKVPHHGTYTHYCPELPNGENYLISTGEKNNRIANQYRTHINSLTNRYCTKGRNHCESIEKYQTCFNPSCINQLVTLEI